MKVHHPLLLLLGAVLAAAALTWMLPAGQFERRDDAATGRRVVVAGTYHRVDRSPVGLFGAAVSLSRGFVAAADVIAVVLFVGGAWVVVDELGALRRVIGDLTGALGGGGIMAIPIVSAAFAAFGALENMQEEIIPLVPALLVLGGAIGVEPVVVVAMSAGAAMMGSAFGPTNPFQAGIALKLAQVPPLASAGLRVALFLAAVGAWIAWTLWYALNHRQPAVTVGTAAGPTSALGAGRARLALAIAVAPMAAYVYGVMRYDWGFNELAGAFFLGGCAAGLVAGGSVARVLTLYVQGMQALIPAAFMVGVARSISVVLDDGRVVDTILNTFANVLGRMPGAVPAFLMIPFHAMLHVVVPSVSGQAVVTMPIMTPLADLLHLPRLVAVLAYETGAGLMEFLTPTNGALMGVLLAAGVPFSKWVRFAVVAVLVAAALSCGAILVLVTAAG